MEKKWLKHFVNLCKKMENKFQFMGRVNKLSFI